MVKIKNIMLNLLILLISILQCTSSKGGLVQVSGRDAACFNDTAVFWCTSDVDGFLTWELIPTFGPTKLVSINRFSHPEGTILRDQIGSTPIVFTVISANTTFIGATLTILNPIPLNGTSIRCNMDTLLLKITLVSDAPPMALNITQNGRTIDINWSPRRNLYYYKEDNESWMSTTQASITLNLTNTTNEISISLCPEGPNISTFTIGSCLFIDAFKNPELIRDYTLFLNGSWTVTLEECYTPLTTCNLSGSWAPNLQCSTPPSYINSMDITNLNEPTEAGEDPKSSIFFSVIPVFFLITIVSTITAILLIFIRNKRRKQSSRDCSDLPEVSENTYQQLSNRHQQNKPSISSRPFQTAETNMIGQDEYSTLHHNNTPQPSTDAYDTVPNTRIPETAKRNLQYGSLKVKSATSPSKTTSDDYSSTRLIDHTKTKNLNYTAVDTTGQSDKMGLNLIHIKVDYADIHLRLRPEDETLNLDSLLIQLRPISKDFRLFGSVAGIAPDILDKIVANSAAPFDGLVEVCDAWLDKCRRERTPPTWSAVAEIISLIGKDKLSHDIMKVYTTGKLPIEVDMNSTTIQGEVHLPTPPPPIPPYREEGNEDANSEVELMTVTSVMSVQELVITKYTSEELDTVMDKPPAIPQKLHAITPVEETEDMSPPPLPPFKDEQTLIFTLGKHEDKQCSKAAKELPTSEHHQIPPLPLKEKKWKSAEKLLCPVTPADDKTPPELPPKLPERKPVPVKRKQSKDDEVMPSLPPRPLKDT